MHIGWWAANISNGCSRLRFVVCLNVFDVLLASQEDGRTRVNGLWLNIQHSLATSRGTTTSLLDQEGHGEAFVENTKLSVLGLAISRVTEDTSIEHSTMDIGYHRSNVTGRVRRLFGVCRELERVKVLGAGCIPVLGVTLVDSVDLPARRDLDL